MADRAMADPSVRRRRLPVLVMAVAVLVSLVVGPATRASAAAPRKLRTTAGALDLGWTLVGETSAAQTFPITNGGPGTASGLTVGTPSDPRFVVTATTCGSSLAAGATCTVTVVHQPTGPSVDSASIVVSASSGSALLVALLGRADAEAFPVIANVTGFDFGSVDLGSTATRETTVINVSNAPRTFSVSTSLSTGPFSVQSTTCTSPTVTLGSGQACAIVWQFAPTSTGDRLVEGTVEIEASGGASRTTPVVLRGHGGPGGFPLRVDETHGDFGSVGVGGLSSSRSVQVTNTTGAPVQVQFGGGAMADFQITTSCGGSPVPAGGTCEFSYRAAPTRPGLIVGTADVSFVVGDEERSFPFRFQVVGTGDAPRVSVSPTALLFGPGAAGVASTPRTITITNSGTAATEDLVIDASDAPEHAITTDCTEELPAGATCELSVVWTPPTAAAALDGDGIVDVFWGTQRASLRFDGEDRSVHEAFVVTADNVFIGDSDDAAAVASAAALDAGTLTRRGYITQLAGSPAWVTELVQDLYRDTLGREGDPGGVAFWVNRLRTGRNSVAQVAAEFYASSEYYNGFGGGDDTIWVTDLYRKLLGRSPDAGGLAYWVGQTASKGRASVSGRMFQSPESRRTRVERLYAALLFRSPDPSGLAYWSGKVLTGGDLVLAVELASSAEFLRLSQYLDL